jgi:ABC-type dipeptide/oligopeptide/nickel transport system permease subunit
VIGGLLVGALVFVASLAPLLTRYDPIVGDVSDGLQAPSGVHWLGTDDQGRDVLARVLFGARISLTVAVISVSIGVVVGVSMGMLAGYAGGTVDLLLMRVVDALLAFPALLLAI